MRNGKYYLSGEKCFASGSDIADYCLVHANLDGDPRKATLFIVDPRAKGFRITRLPKAMGKSARGHPEVTLDNVEVDPSDVLGEVGQGFELTKDWFVEARVYIGARCVGQAIRAAEIANEWAATRVQFGRPIRDFQAIEFMLADMAVEIMAAKSMLYRVAAEIDGGLERKAAHARVSAVKLFSSEMSGRVVDKALQILGGRGYFNDSAVERLYRATRVERIVEGTSEIQRVIIGGQIKKRGLALYTD
jgi:alkylation response protein AidB-like acyl-CoA dehydrogenase